jgi:hypothetical protein
MGKTARFLNVILGLWLIVSASLWPHSPPQFVTTWVLGVLCAAAAALAAVKPPVRYMNTIFSVLLFISAFTLNRSGAATLWHNALVAIAIFGLSLVRPEDGRPAPFTAA